MFVRHRATVVLELLYSSLRGRSINLTDTDSLPVNALSSLGTVYDVTSSQSRESVYSDFTQKQVKAYHNDSY